MSSFIDDLHEDLMIRSAIVPDWNRVAAVPLALTVPVFLTETA
jgi:hypothetical protein